jgi:hypothetical protein
MWEKSRRLYAAEFSGGVIKVGITSIGDGRISSLRLRGEPAIRFYVGQQHQCGMKGERELLNKVGDLAQLYRDHTILAREWFTGIPFREACRLVDEVSASLQPA